MRHRKLLILGIFLLVATAVAVVVYQKVARPAKAILLLPDGNLLVYVNFSPAHFLDLGQMPIESEQQYQDFLRQTGFHFEHDLNTIAFSQRNPGDMNSESSAIFTGSFDQDRLQRYLQKLSTGSENYDGRTIFSIRGADHVVRACIVDSNTVAITNMESPEPMHSIIEKARGSFSTRGPSLLQEHYDDVPFGSLAWAIFRMPTDPRAARLPGDINADFLQNTTSVLSVRYTGSIRVRAEVISQSEADAAKVREAANLFIAFGKSIGQSVAAQGPDKDVNAAFDSIQVEQKGNRTVLSATIPQDAVRKMADKMNH